MLTGVARSRKWTANQQINSMTGNVSSMTATENQIFFPRDSLAADSMGQIQPSKPSARMMSFTGTIGSRTMS